MALNSRYEGLFTGMTNHAFHILGCGAIGSSAALQLARMGATNFQLYDYDTVEDVNIGVSQYINNDIGKKKVDALADHIIAIESIAKVVKNDGEFDTFNYQDQNDIVILGFDSMKARMDAVKILCSNPITIPKCIIDGRMGAEHYQQYVLTNPTVKKYEKVWYSDEAGDPEPCNAKATSYCSNMSGSFIANAVRKYITNSPLNKDFSFNFPTMIMETM